MIDISDGLTADLGHICDASSVGALLDLVAIPIDENLSVLSLSDDDRLSLAMGGGEDFELLFTVDPSRANQLAGKDFYRIGEITSKTGVIEGRINDRIETLKPTGYRHF